MLPKRKDDKMAIFYNSATIYYNGQSLNSNRVSAEFTETITMTKTAISSSYSLGDSIAYVISIINSGAAPADNLSIRDNLGAYNLGGTTLVPLTYRDGSLLYYIDGVLQPTPTVSVGTELTISNINIPAGSNATLIYEATVNGFAPLAEGSSITNTVTLDGCQAGTTISDTATVPVTDEPNLSIAKSVCPEVITCSGELTYTFIIQNTGNTPIVTADDVVITDTFDPILTNITVTLNGAPLTLGTGYTYNESTGEFATIAGVVTVDSATYTQDPVSGLITVNPGVSVLTVSGTV